MATEIALLNPFERQPSSVDGILIAPIAVLIA